MSLRTALSVLSLGLWAGLASLGGCGGVRADGPWECRDGVCVCNDDEHCGIECLEIPCEVDCNATSSCDAVCEDLCVFDCTSSSSCDVECGADCLIDCRSISTCAARCGERCDYTCESASDCDVSVGPDSDVRCSSFGGCRVECLGSCRVDCPQGGCDITCALGSPEDTGGGNWVCPG